MTRPLALLRPEPGWSASADSARGAGLEVIGHPLFDPQPVAWQAPPGDFDALLVGSAAVFLHGGSQLDAVRALPVHAVGEVTAAAARRAGFRVVGVGTGGLQRLLDGAAGEPLRFLRLAGEERVPLAAHPRQNVTECAVYRMAPRPLDPAFAGALAMRRPVVALHSAAAARRFAGEIDRVRIERGMLTLLALGPRIAAAAGHGWAAVHLAATPSDAALLAKATALCN